MNSDSPEGLPQVASQLGATTAEFSARRGWLMANMIAGPIAVLIGVPMFIFGIVAAVAILRGEVKKGALRGPVLAVGLGSLLIGAGIYVPLRAYRNWGLKVLVFEKGFVHFQKGRIQVFRWDQIQTVWQQISKAAATGILGDADVLTVVRSDDIQVRIDDHIARRKTLGQLVQKETLKHMLPSTVAAFERGEIVDFGPLGISSEGLHNKHRVLPWSDLADMKLDKKGSLTVSQRGKWLNWLNVPANQIPNAHVLLALVKHARRANYQ